VVGAGDGGMMGVVWRVLVQAEREERRRKERETGMRGPGENLN
jgi:hypothetical protein